MKYARRFVQFQGFDGVDDDPEPKDPPKTYTQEEFDAHLGGQRRKYETQIEGAKQASKELAEKLEQQKKMKGLSEDERTSLQTRIDELESTYLTEKEKADRAAAAEREQFTGQLSSATVERDNWRTQYQQEVLNNRIRSAANAHKAFDRTGDQIAAILAPLTEFRDILDDSDQPTGQVKPVVRFPDNDVKTKEPIVLEYTVDEAIKRMTELDKHANLFEDTMRGGLAGSKNGGRPAGKLDIVKLAKENPAEYRRLRKESPELIQQAMKGR